jgi:predicted transcriptional regulator
MQGFSRLALLQGNSIILVSSEEGPLSLDEVSGRIVTLLNSKREPLTGSQLARELNVGESTITKATDRLVRIGVLRKEPSDIARNVKQYTLLIRVIDNKYIADVEKRVPKAIRDVMTGAFKGHEMLALAFSDQLMDYIAALPDDRRAAVLEEFLKQIGLRKNAGRTQEET